MANQKLIITGTVTLGKGKKIGAGTSVTEIDPADKKYGLKKEDIQRIIEAGAGYLSDGSQSSNGDAIQGPSHERLAELITAIGQLDPENPAQYTEAGVPECDAMAKQAGGKVSVADRDAAFALFKVAQPGVAK